MKIAFEELHLGSYNGNSVYATGLIRALAAAFPGDEYGVFTYWSRRRRVREIVGRLPAVRIGNILPHPLVVGKAFRRQVEALDEWLLRRALERADLYHCTNPVNFAFGIKNPVVTILDLIALRQEEWVPQGSKEYYHKNIARVIEESRVVFTISNHTRADILRRFPGAEEKVIVTYLGVDDRFRRLPDIDRSFLDAFGYPQAHPPFLLYVGETQPRKNVHGLIAAFAEVPPTARKNMHLVIAGDSLRRDYRERLFSLVQKTGLQDFVHFYRGVSHDDLVRFYNAAHAFVFPSFYEGFGIPVAEAMQCGCPVLTSTASSLPEVGGDAALYADPDDTDALKEKMRQIIGDDGLRQSLREKGYLQAAKFTWKKTAALTHEGYRRIVR
ncbi:MAG: glycosyltransferase family 4 protein [Chitinispirillaceae bacterium]|nr:glycosyltransferase family 4 protein [Chitinispirillaceae bacterium]